MPKNEKTSQSIGSIAGRLLNGKQFSAAVDWLASVAINPAVKEEDRAYASMLLTTINAMRSVAASALTQRPGK